MKEHTFKFGRPMGPYLYITREQNVDAAKDRLLKRLQKSSTSQRAVDVSSVDDIVEFKPDVEDFIDIRVILVKQGGGWAHSILKDVLEYRTKNKQETWVLCEHYYPGVIYAADSMKASPIISRFPPKQVTPIIIRYEPGNTNA